MAKKVLTEIKLQAVGGQASPAPPVGPALGQHGINIMEFCKAFNARSQEMEAGQPTPVIITYFTDKSFQMEIKTPPASFLLKKAAKLQSASKAPGKDVAGSVTVAQLREIAEKKLGDLNAHDVDQAAKIIAGTARSMGVEVVA